MSFAELKRLFIQTWTEWNADQAPRLGAALAYYTVLSLAPLLLLLIAAAGLIFGQEAAQGQLMAQITDLVGKEGGQAIQSMVQNASRPGSGILASLIGFAVLIFGASTVAAELKASLDAVWNKRPPENAGITHMVKERSYALGVVLGCGFLLLVSLVVSSAIAAAGSFASSMLPFSDVVMHVLNLLLSILVITAVFAVLFKYLPEVNVAWGDVLPGAAFTSVLFSIGKTLIGLYLGKASFGSTYGAAGSLVIVLVWVYYSSQILFFGAEFTQVYAKSHGSDPLQTRHRSRQQEPREISSSSSLERATAHGNSGLQADSEDKAAGVFGSLVGSALAVTRIVRGFRR